MSNFIQGDDFDRPGGKAEEKVWQKVKEAFTGREVLGYSRYPLFSRIGEKRKEPDILLLDKEIGVIVIEVKAFFIEDIESVIPNHWVIRNSYERTLNPIGQVEDYLYTLDGKFSAERKLRRKYKGKAIVALPNINREQWKKKGFNKGMESAPIILGNELGTKTLMRKINDIEDILSGDYFDNERYKIVSAILGHEINHVRDEDYYLKEGTKAKICNSIETKLYNIDIQQENIGKTIPPGPQRIRGIAGSGKTLLLCQKAAYMHLKYPKWRIALVFFTQSLYDNIIKTLDMYLKAFSNGDVGYDPYSNLKVMHAWGRVERTGFYREVAQTNDIRPLNVNDVKKHFGVKYVEPTKSLNYACKTLLECKNGNLEEMFDAILIDEGQDLVASDEVKYKNKQPFYYMAYKSLKPISDNDPNIRRMVWAYDELQSLETKKIPSGKEILGSDQLIKGSYKGGIKKSEIMRKCYRTPYEILTVAHALGMGLLREEGMITGYTTKTDWDNIGYEVVEGDFRKEGNMVLINRPIENSPNPISEFYKGHCIEFNTYNSNIDMMKQLAKCVRNDIVLQKLKPDRQILIINLKQKDYKKEYLALLCNELKEQGVNYYIPSFEQYNTIYNNGKSYPERFWCEEAVTISNVIRAEGNEANMVYIIGLDEVARNEGDINYRNKLFVALTRAKCWVKVMAVGNYSLYHEFQRAIEAKGAFRFKFRKPKQEVNDLEVE